MPINEDKLDRILDLLERQLTSKRNRRGEYETYTDDKDLFESWKAFSRKVRRDIEENYNLLQKQQEQRRKNLLSILQKDGVNIPEAIQEKINASFDESNSKSEQARFWDEAVEMMEKTFSKDNPSVQKFLKSLDEIAELNKKIRQDRKNLGESRVMHDTLYRQAKNRTENMFSHVGINSANYENSPWYIVLKELIEKKNDNFLRLYFTMLGSQFTKMITPLNLFLNMMRMMKDETVKMVKSLDEAEVGFLKATGLSSEFADSIRDSYSEVRYLGVSLEQLSQAQQSYMNKISPFSKLTRQSQKDLMSFGSVVNRLGVSLEDSGAMFNFFMSSLRATPEGAKQGFLRVAAIADKFGESISKISSEFVQMIPTLSKWGARMESVFAQVEAVRKSLNLTGQEVLQVAEGFDTFDSAAQNVGRLNAILGGPFLNTMQLLNSNEADVIRQLHEAFKMSGKSWQALSRHERQAIANAAGIRDMDLAQRLFTGSLADYNANLAKQSLTQEELNERSRRATTIAEKFQMVLSSLAIAFEPIVDALQWLMNGLVWLTDHLRGATIPVIFLLVGGLRGLVGVFTSLGVKLVGLIPKFLQFIPLLRGTSSAAVSLGGAVSGAIASLAAASTTAAGAAQTILLVGGAIAVVAGMFVFFKEASEGFGKLIGGFGSFLQSAGMTQFANAVGDMANDVPGKFERVANSIQSMSLAMSSIPTANISSYIDSMDSIENIASSVQNSFATDFINSIRDVSMRAFSITPKIDANGFNETARNESKQTEIVQNLMNKLDTIIEALTSDKGVNSKPIKVAIELDGDVLAEKVIDVVNDYGRLR